MIFRGLLTIALAFAGTAAFPAGKPRDEAFLRAYEAFRAGDPIKLAKNAAGLEDHILAQYLEYWRLKLRIEEMSNSEARDFLARYPGSYLAERLRSDWLKALGQRSDWQTFDLELAPLVQDDLEVRCYMWTSRLAKGEDTVFDQAKAMWLEPKELPDGCNALAEVFVRDGRLRVKDAWRRARVLFEAGQLTAAQRVLEYLPADEAPDARELSQAATSPEKFLANVPSTLDSRPQRELVLLALMRVARSEPRAAAEFLRTLGERLPEADRAFAWSRVAYQAARRHLPEAVGWFRLAGKAEMNDEHLAWEARAALRSGDWQMVRDAIDPMSVAARQDPAWTYWYARALAAQDNPEGARAYYLRISDQPHFYGLLATEDLGQPFLVPQPFHAPTQAEVENAKANAGLARALALYALGLRTEGTREWVFSIRSMDDAQLLAAAELARRAEVYDRAINTAERTSQVHNFQVRFLAPFRDVFRQYAKAYDLEEAWVLGITRQESRFIADARSSAGARGLMQLMPATAKWVARKIGIHYSPERVAEVGTNVTLGTRYLRYVLEDLGHPVLASTAYNAGPGRARRWRDTKPMEGAIYVETIPFNETRDYVKKVMANTVFYAALQGEGKPLSLRQRLGTISAKAANDRFDENLP